MENKELTPSESLALISDIILEAKSRFQDNGFSFIFLGLCCFAASFGQFSLLKLGYNQINYYPYFIMPLAGVVTYFYYKKKRGVVRPKNQISSVLSILGAAIGLNVMVAGFLFWDKFGIGLIPFILILFSIWSILTGVLIKNKISIVSGVLINVIAFFAFFIEREYHPLVLSVVSLLGFVFPGILFNYSQKKSRV
jgi:hypothetical protein